MRKFEFPLRSVLRLRRFAEAQARQALMEAVAELRAAEEALAATRREIGAQTARLQEHMDVLLPAEIALVWMLIERLGELALKQVAEVAEKETVVAAKQEAYIAAQRERKPLERLEEEMRRAHYQAADLADQAVTDELAMINHSRRGGDP